MGLASTAIVTLSVGITKALIKLWLDDRTVAIAAGRSIADLIGLKVKDALKKKDTKRYLDQIGDDVAKSVSTLFEAEGIDVDEGGQEAVAREVAIALDDPLLSPQGMAEANLDKDLVAQALMRKYAGKKRSFSEPESAMFDRMLMEAAQRTLRIVQVLPNFQVAALGTILSRQADIHADVRRVLADIQRMWEAAEHNADRRVARFETRYRQAIEDKLNRVQLFGIRTGTRSYPLNVAFVTLEAEQDVDHEETHLEGSVHEVLGQAGNRVWVTGIAGAGKTTLLQWLAVQVARDDLPETLADWSGRVPFFIRLRQFYEGDFPSPRTWVRAAVQALDGSAPRHWVNDRLDDGRAVVLIDGIDEVVEGRREAFRAWAEELMAVYPKVIWVFSSRPLTDGGVELTGVREIALRSMGQAQVRTFIEHWHAAVAEEVASDEEGLAELGEALQTRLRDRPNLRRLITNPLLCAMVCALHRDRRKLLPDGRRGLYDACTEMLLDLRDRQREVPDASAQPLSFNHKRALLAELAYYMLRNGLSVVPFEQMDTQFKRTLPRLGLSDPPDQDALRRLMVERSGMLRMPEPGRVDFVHKSFMEFLAAEALLAAGDIGALVDKATESGWREVYLHAASQTRGAAEAGGLVQATLKRAKEGPGVPHQLILLAFAALHEIRQIEPADRQCVVVAVDELGQPEKLSEAEYWSAAGDLVVPVIAGILDRRPSSRVVCACVRVLAQVGSPAALDVLSSRCSHEQRQAVRRALIYGVEFILGEQRTEYVLRVLGAWLCRIDGPRASIDISSCPPNIGVSILDALGKALAERLRREAAIGELFIAGSCGAGRLLQILCKSLPALRVLGVSIEGCMRHGLGPWLGRAELILWMDESLDSWKAADWMRVVRSQVQYALHAIPGERRRVSLDTRLWDRISRHMGVSLLGSVQVTDTLAMRFKHEWWD